MQAGRAVQPVGHFLRHRGICEPSRGCEPLEVGVKESSCLVLIALRASARR